LTKIKILAIIYIEGERSNLSKLTNQCNWRPRPYGGRKKVPMTKREFLNVVAESNMADEIKEYAKAQLEKMDYANEKRRNKLSKKALENLPIIEEIEKMLTSEPQTATVIGEHVGISTQKASSLLRKVVASGFAEKVDVKVKGKGTQKGYLLAK